MKIAVIAGTVFGNADEVARVAVSQLEQAGFSLHYNPKASLGELNQLQFDALLAVSSTTGMGELPGNIVELASEIRDTFPRWAGKGFAVIGLGDSSYGDTYCAAGRQLVELFEELGMQQIQAMCELDASESVTPEVDVLPWLKSLSKTLQKA